MLREMLMGRPGGMGLALNSREAAMRGKLSRAVAACRSAQKERAALQQILDTKVLRIASELVALASSPLPTGGQPHQAAQQQQVLAAKLRSLEALVGRTVDAIKYAPPLLEDDDVNAVVGNDLTVVS